MVPSDRIYTIDGAMALSIKDPETERTAAEPAALTGNSKTGAIRPLRESSFSARPCMTTRGSEGKVPALPAGRGLAQVPAEIRGQRISKAEREEILGHGP
jgi:antitoxin VapB